MEEVTDLPLPRVFQAKLSFWTSFSPVPKKKKYHGLCVEIFRLDDHNGPFWLQNTQIYKHEEMSPNLPKRGNANEKFVPSKKQEILEPLQKNPSLDCFLSRCFLKMPQ